MECRSTAGWAQCILLTTTSTLYGELSQNLRKMNVISYGIQGGCNGESSGDGTSVVLCI